MLSAVVIAADSAAVLLAASKLLNTAKPLWASLPRWASVALPVVVAVVPQVIAQLAGATSSLDLANVAIMAAALLVPGIKEAEAPAPPPAA